MKVIFRLTLYVFLIVLCSQASLLRIPYTGGKQTGSFKIAGDWPNQSTFSDPAFKQIIYADTVIIDSNLVITTFRATKSFTPSCGFVPVYQYGLSFKIQNGLQGKLGGVDTLWGNAKTFPDILGPMDSIPMPTYSLNKDLGSKPSGINVAHIITSGDCLPSAFTFISGYNKVVYFRFNRGAVPHYGKLVIHGYEVLDTFFRAQFGVVADFNLAYTISDTKDLDSGPVGLYLIKSKNGNARNLLFPDQLFDLNGRLQKPPTRAYPSIPLLPR